MEVPAVERGGARVVDEHRPPRPDGEHDREERDQRPPSGLLRGTGMGPAIYPNRGRESATVVAPCLRARLIVPRYNEEARLDRRRFLDFSEDTRIRSFSSTTARRTGRGTCSRDGGGEPRPHRDVPMPKNVGKGRRSARASSARSTRGRDRRLRGRGPLDAAGGADCLLAHPEVPKVPGGHRRARHAHRSPHRWKRMRHYLGRIFASIAGGSCACPSTTPVRGRSSSAPRRSARGGGASVHEPVGVRPRAPRSPPRRHGDERGIEPGEIIEVPARRVGRRRRLKVSVAAMAKTLVDLAQINRGGRASGPRGGVG